MMLWAIGPLLLAVVGAKELVILSFALASRASSLSAAAKALEEISDPASPKFGHYWTSSEVSTHFEPSKESREAVARWLESSGIPRSIIRLSADRGHLRVALAATKAEQLFGKSSKLHARGRDTTVHTYSVPPSLSGLVDYILPAYSDTTLAPRRANQRVARRQHISRQTNSTLPGTNSTTPRKVDCFKYMSPECLRLLYNMPPLSAGQISHPENSFGVFQLAWQTWLEEDLDAFFYEFAPPLVGARPAILAVNGGYRQRDHQISAFNLEPNLDFEYAMSLAHPLPVGNIQVGGITQAGNTNMMLAAFDGEYCETGIDAEFDAIVSQPGDPHPYNGTDCGTLQPPRVISISAAWNEANFSHAYVQRQCEEYLKLGLQGVTVIVASGDRGTEDQLESCHDMNKTLGRFSANFPASCPWVTTVGGTQLDLPAGGNATWMEGTPFPGEVSFRVHLHNYTFTSGGGFSGAFAAPAYQKDAIGAYLDGEHKSHLANLSSSGFFNIHGRGYPDISTAALNYLVQSNGKLRTTSGTSASAPVFAAMVSKINDERLKVGKSPVGFINPVLYGPGRSALRQVVTGTNRGCGVENAFPAADAWDAVTGLGTPDYEKLLAVYLALP